MSADRKSVLVRFPAEILEIIDARAAELNLARCAALLTIIVDWDDQRRTAAAELVPPAKVVAARIGGRRMGKTAAALAAAEAAGHPVRRAADLVPFGYPPRPAPGSLLIDKKYRSNGPTQAPRRAREHSI